VVLTSTCASMRVCHLRTRERSLSDVKSMPWKFVRQFLPWTSSTRSLILRKDCSSSLLRSASDTSTMRPLRESFAFFRPCDLLTSVLPTLRTSKMDGALMSYHSLREKGSTTFFLIPFLPFERRLFLPTAMVEEGE